MRLPLILLTVCILLASACGRHGVSPELAALIADTVAPNPYDRHLDSAPDAGCVKLRIRGIGGTLGRVFNDSNYRHINAARAGGIEPIHDVASAWTQGQGLVKIKSNKYYYLDELTHSYPYLKPHAAMLLDEICARFHDSLQARGGGAYRPKVTSVLRSPMTVGRLRRVNRNASGESAHQFATTFDISYSKFICDNASAPRRTFEDLKNLLAEIVADLRREGRCVVKHERRQACLHITALPDSV